MPPLVSAPSASLSPVTSEQANTNEGAEALVDIYSGNLYAELVGEDWAPGRRQLRTSCTALVRRYPAIQALAAAKGATVEQFLLDTMFAHLLPAQLSLAALTMRNDSAVAVALRLSGDARPDWPFPKGVALVAKANWRLRYKNGDTIRQPVLQIVSFHDGPVGGARDFEANLNVTCVQTARQGSGIRKERNVLTERLVEALPEISEITRDRLRDWSDFLEWKRRLIRAGREGLRYISCEAGGDQRSAIFTVIGEDEASLRRTINRLAKSDSLAAFDPSVSEDEWVMRFPEGEREPRGSEIGGGRRGRVSVVPAGPVDGCPWREPVLARIAFSLSDDTLAKIEQSDDPSAAVDRALQRLPGAGFVVPSAVQDLSQVNRQGRALSDLSDQGGFSPYLARYIFDAAQARRPGGITSIGDWHNPLLNDAQRLAVQKIVGAPDLCLVQGPPGTGKTTVIAESIAQVVARNETVLLASQTHTAVDNALGKLPLHPSIRAVRLTRNEDRLSEEGQEFLNERALGRHYKSIVEAVSSRQEEARVEADFARRASRVRDAATRHIGDLERAEAASSDLSEQVRSTTDRYLQLERQLEAARVRPPGLDGVPSGLDSLRSIDHGLRELREHLPGFRAHAAAVLDGRPPTSAPPGSQRAALQAQLERVLEAMKVDASAVTEYQRLQAELAELDDEPRNTVDVSRMPAYFPGSEPILTEPTHALVALLQKGKRDKVARDVLGRIGQVEAALSSIDELKLQVDGLGPSMSEAQRNLESLQRTAREFCDGPASELLGPISTRASITSASLRDSLDEAWAHQSDRLARAKELASEVDVWGDVQNDWIADLTSLGAVERDWEAIGDEWLAECNVVGVTCNENPATLDDPGLTNFDLAIVDEVSKATPLELLLPLMRARRSTLVGDHRQLPPMFREGQDAEGITEESDEDVPEALALTPENLKKYEKFVTASLFRTHFERADESIKQRLTIQHRMHPDIMDSVNRFYEGQLTSGIANPDVDRAHGLTILGRGNLPVISPQHHMVWIDTTHDDRGQPWREPAPGSGLERTNVLEARLIARMLRDIDDAWATDPARRESPAEIGIVSMYQAQVRCIREEIKKEIKGRPFRAIKWELNTVVKYQGKEKPIILVSMVRNFGPSASTRRRSSRANVARFEYINVAFSRAQRLLVVFGARDTFAPYQVELPPMDAAGSPTTVGVYKEIADVVERKGAMKQASALGELLPRENGASRR